MKIWLDDLRDPNRVFRVHYPEDQYECQPDLKDFLEKLVWVKTAEEAVEYLKNGLIDEIFFDHDLGPGMSGSQFANLIEEGAAVGSVKRIRWHGHTSNPVGRALIVAAMTSADRFWSQHERNDRMSKTDDPSKTFRQIRNDILSTYSTEASKRMASEDQFWIEGQGELIYGVFERDGVKYKVKVDVSLETK